MNEQIKQLAKDAGINLTPAQFSGVLEDEVDEFTLEKFAQLIVRECLVQVNEVYTTLDNSDEQVGVARVGLTIAVHFGVEL